MKYGPHMTERKLRAKGAPPKMSAEELRKRLDGRAPRYVEQTYGFPNGQMAAWASGYTAVPDRHVDKLKALFPLPEEDLFEEGRQAGYRQAISDAHIAIGDLKP